MLILFKVLKNYHILYIVLYENIQLLVFLFEQINLKTIMQDFKKWKNHQVRSTLKSNIKLYVINKFWCYNFEPIFFVYIVVFWNFNFGP